MSRAFPETVSDLTADDYMRLAWYTARIAPFGMKEDTKSEVVLALLRQVPRFDATKGKLSSFLFTRAYWAAVDYMEAEHKHDKIRPKFEYVNHKSKPTYEIDELQELEVIDPSYLSQEDMIDLKRIFIKRREHIAKYEAQKNSGKATARGKAGKRSGILYIKVMTVASRRDNMPDPRHMGFPWKDR